AGTLWREGAFLLPHGGRRAVRLGAESDPCAPRCATAREQGRLSRTTRAREEPRSHDLCRHVRGAAWRDRARESQRNNETPLLEAYGARTCGRSTADDQDGRRVA